MGDLTRSQFHVPGSKFLFGVPFDVRSSLFGVLGYTDEPRTPNLEPRTSNLERNQEQEPGTRNLELGTALVREQLAQGA
jgi:hypothetical protein